MGFYAKSDHLGYVNEKLLAGVSLTGMDRRVIIIACSIK